MLFVLFIKYDYYCAYLISKIMDKKRIKFYIFVVSLVLVLAGLFAELQWIEIHARFFVRYKKFFAPIGYFVYVLYDRFS